MKMPNFAGFVGYCGDNVWVDADQQYEDDAGLVKARPELFDDVPEPEPEPEIEEPELFDDVPEPEPEPEIEEPELFDDVPEPEPEPEIEETVVKQRGRPKGSTNKPLNEGSPVVKPHAVD